MRKFAFRIREFIMHSLILILLVTIGGSSVRAFGFYSHCDIVRLCDSALPPEFTQMLANFPPNEFQLKELCPPILSLGDCYRSVIQDCTGQTVEELATSENETVSLVNNFLNNILKLNQDICNEETQLSKNYVENIQCFKEMVTSTSAGQDCRKEGQRMLEAYRMSLPYIEGEEETIEHIISESTCMTMAYEMVCIMKQVQQRCGDAAKDVYLEIIKRLQILKLGICSEGELVTLRGRFVDFLEEQGEQRDVIANAFAFRRRK